MAPISAIVVEKDFNVRIEMGDIEALAKSIAKIGLQTPLVGRKVGNQIVLTAGHRRLLAVSLANKKFIGKKGFLQEPIDYVKVITTKGNDTNRTLVMLLDGEGAKLLTNNEMVQGIARLLDEGMKPKDIIDSLGVSLSQAQRYNLVKAAKAPKAVQALMDEGKVSLATVNKLQRQAKDDAELIDLVNEAVESGEKSTKKVTADVQKLEDAIALADPTSAKAAMLKAIVNKLKAKASAEDIAKLLK
ncbi:MAG: ParB/RepB/Spo0J family partition protein [Candidatus Heimdallarchaeaceae archaeon]